MKNMKNKTTKNNMINYGIVIVLFVIVQALSSTGNLSRLLMGLLVPLCVYTIASVSLNLVVGFSGELSLGHAGFMCVGAFSSAFCTKMLEGVIGSQIVLFIIALLVGTAMAAFFGFLIGIPVLRLRGDYLAIVTLAFGEIIKNIINVLYIAKDGSGFHFAISNGNAIDLADDGVWLINGAKGIAKIPHLSSFTAGVILILISLFVVYNLVNSRSGRAIMAIRDNRIAAESVGINITKFKLMAFTISAAIAGAGGVLCFLFYAFPTFPLSRHASLLCYPCSFARGCAPPHTAKQRPHTGPLLYAIANASPGDAADSVGLAARL